MKVLDVIMPVLFGLGLFVVSSIGAIIDKMTDIVFCVGGRTKNCG